MSCDEANNGDGQNQIEEYLIMEGLELLRMAFSSARLSIDGKNVKVPQSAAIEPGSLSDGVSKKECETLKIPETLYIMAFDDGKYLSWDGEIPVFLTAEDGRKMAKIILPRGAARRCRPRPVSTEEVFQYAEASNNVVFVDQVSKRRYRQMRLRRN